jgi:hypothetical protein
MSTPNPSPASPAATSSLAPTPDAGEPARPQRGLRWAYGVAGTQTSRARDQEMGPVFTVLGLMQGLGWLSLVAYAGGTAGDPGGFLQRTGVYSAVALAASTAGAVAGFIFGIPRSLQGDAPAADGVMRGAVATPRDNTNLEQISDWLTKILVGVGLTQIGHLGGALATVSKVVAAGLGGAAALQRSDATVAGATIVYFLICGFLSVYLWTRLYLPGAMVASARYSEDLSRHVREEVRFQVGDLRTEVVRDVRTEVVHEVARDAMGVGGRARDDSRVEEARLARIKRGAGKVADDPWSGQFGGKSEQPGRRLSAEVGAAEDGYFPVELRVEATDGAKPLPSAVRFFIHPTFNNPTPVVPVRDGRATLNLRAWGAFTVGAVTDGGETELELDLSALESAPRKFREL